MENVFFDENSIRIGLNQIHNILKLENFDDYVLLGLGDGGYNVASRLKPIGKFENICRCDYTNGIVSFEDESKIKDKKILVCEYTVRTGNTFNKIYAKLKDMNVQDIKLLSLLMRKNSDIVPNFYIFETDRNTKIYFPWTDYPIRKYLKGIVRKVSLGDCKKEFKCNNPAINKFTLSDYYKNSFHGSNKTYLIEEDDKICSVINFFEKIGPIYSELYLDVIATSNEVEHQGYGTSLLGVLYKYMLYHDFDFIRGFAFSDVDILDFYKDFGFEIIGEVNNDDYGKMHEMILINPEKEVIIDFIRTCR